MPLLPRLHLFEFVDQPWLPQPLRRGVVDNLRIVLDRMRPYYSVAPQLAELLRTAGTNRVVGLWMAWCRRCGPMLRRTWKG